MIIKTRGAALAGALMVLYGAMPGAAAQGQETSPSARSAASFRIAAGATLSTALVDDANGTTVRYGLGPALAIGGARPMGSSVTGTVTARISRSPIHVDYGDLGSQSDGSAWVVDAVAALEGLVAFCDDASARGCTSLHGGLGAIWAAGADDVFPFSTHTGPKLAAELGAAVRLSSARPLSLTLSGQAFRYGGESIADPIGEPGTVFRLFVGVRHGR
jgi:hypothetical protein